MRDTPEILVVDTIDAVPVELPIAGIGSRAYAFIIDWHIRVLVALLWAVLAIAAIWLGSSNPRHAFGRVTFVPAVLIYLAYHPVLETLASGWTPGKQMAGVRILKNDGSVPGFGTHLVRNLFRLIDCLPVFYGLGLISMFSDKRQRRIGDLASGTLAVLKSAPVVGAIDSLASSKIPPKLALLIGELLSRWKELDEVARAPMARQLIERAGGTMPPAASDQQLLDALRAISHD